MKHLMMIATLMAGLGLVGTTDTAEAQRRHNRGHHHHHHHHGGNWNRGSGFYFGYNTYPNYYYGRSYYSYPSYYGYNRSYYGYPSYYNRGYYGGSGVQLYYRW